MNSFLEFLNFSSPLKRQVFFVIMLSGLILVFIMAGIAYQDITRSLRVSSEEENYAVLKRFENRLYSFIKQEIEYLNVLHEYYRFNGRDELIALLDHDLRYYDSYIFCTQGIVRHAKNQHTVGYQYQNNDVYLLAMDSENAIFSTRFHPFDNVLLIEFIIPVFDDSGELLYAAVHQYNAELLESILVDENPQRKADVLFIDDSGIIFFNIMTTKMSDEEFRVFPSIAEYGLTKSMLDRYDDTDTLFEIEQYQILLHKLDGDFGFVATRMSLVELQKRLSEVYYAILLLCVFTVIMYAFLANFLSGLLIKPIKDLSEMVSLRSSSNDAKIEVHENSELKGLVDSLNTLWEKNRIFQDKLISEKNKAEEANKAKSQFLANVSHEIRTPMNGIIGLLNLVLRKTDDKEIESYLRKVKGSAENLLDIINDILDLSKIESGSIRLTNVEFSIRELVDELYEIFLHEVSQKKLDIKLQVDPNVPNYVYGDALKIKQVYINLIGNAIKFTETGSISISVNALRLEERSGLVEFSVSDTGIGIAEDQFEKLFLPFSQIDDSTTKIYKGTGLGLNISKRLVEAMGGELYFHSHIGKGSCFAFSLALPLVDEKKVLAAQEDKIFNALTKTKEYIEKITLSDKNILVVEDNIINQEIAKEILAELEFNVLLADNGEEALAVVHNEVVDLIIMDIQMPVMDGYTCSRKIREIDDPVKNSVPIIALTANALKDDDKLAYESGMNDYIAKPYDPYVMIEKVRFWLVRQDNVNAAAVDEDIAEEHAVEDKKSRIDFTYGLKLVAGKTNTFLRILGIFEKDLQKGLKNIEEAFDNADVEELKKELHKLKGVSGNLGLHKLSKLCSYFEEAVKDDKIDVLDFSLLELEAEYVQQQIAEFLKTADPDISAASSKSVIDKQAFMEKLKILKNNLNEGYFIDEKLLDDLQSKNFINAEQEELVNAMVENIRNYNYDVAMLSLNRLFTSLSI